MCLGRSFSAMKLGFFLTASTRGLKTARYETRVWRDELDEEDSSETGREQGGAGGSARVGRELYSRLLARKRGRF